MKNIRRAEFCQSTFSGLENGQPYSGLVHSSIKAVDQYCARMHADRVIHMTRLTYNNTINCSPAKDVGICLAYTIGTNPRSLIHRALDTLELI